MISIVGSGPVGAYAAYLLSKSGYDVDIFEEHEKVGKPVQCTGIVSSAIKDVLPLKQDWIVNKIKVANIISPNNSSVEIKFKKPNLVIDRTKFDQHLVDMAINAGAGLFKGHQLVEAKNRQIKFKTKNGFFMQSPKYIVGADGPNSLVGRSYGLINKRKYLIGSQLIVKLKNENMVEFYPMPEGFAWVVPENEETCRVGMAAYRNVQMLFSQFLKKRCPETKPIAKQAGLIPVYDPKQKTQKDNVYLVGDAAGMVKSTTGGGIVQGLLGAKALDKAIRTKQNYQTTWKNYIGKELWMHLQVRKLMDRFSKDDYNRLIKLSLQDKITKVLAENERDYLLPLMLKILVKEPRYLFFAKNFFKR